MNLKRVRLLLDLGRVYRMSSRDDKPLWTLTTKDLRREAHRLGLTRRTHRSDPNRQLPLKVRAKAEGRE